MDQIEWIILFRFRSDKTRFICNIALDICEEPVCLNRGLCIISASKCIIFKEQQNRLFILGQCFCCIIYDHLSSFKLNVVQKHRTRVARKLRFRTLRFLYDFFLINAIIKISYRLKFSIEYKTDHNSPTVRYHESTYINIYYTYVLIILFIIVSETQ